MKHKVDFGELVWLVYLVGGLFTAGVVAPPGVWETLYTLLCWPYVLGVWVRGVLGC